MRTADHMNLSRYIMDHMDAGASKLKKAAFIFGSIEPDINMLTYFRGSIHGEEKLRGHNYENVQKYMEKLTNKLTKKLEQGQPEDASGPSEKDLDDMLKNLDIFNL